MDRQARKLANRSNQDERCTSQRLVVYLVIIKVLILQSILFLTCFLLSSDEEMEEANPIEANDSDYDPTKETKKEVKYYA